jgi:AMMECR1 domain-containing protein
MLSIISLLKATWEKKCKELLLPEGPGVETLEKRFDYLRQNFPKAKMWLTWWHASEIQAMLFKARKRLPEDDPPLPGEETSEDEDEISKRRKKKKKKLPSTTNAQESLHRVYYKLW